jgi:hypothetical protein
MYFRLILFAVIFMLHATRSESQVNGCTDRLAVNYNPSASINDGSCVYSAASIVPLASIQLDDVLAETSGLIFWNNYLWTHNDNTDNNIYALDTIYGTIEEVYSLSGIENIDWEEISQDEDYIYIGDIGNNSGNRRNLRIYRISKNSIIARSPVIDTIQFSYSDQVNFTPSSNDTDFDCEAFIVSTDSIYLFTKQWVSKGTSLYALQKNPGDHIAELRSSLDVNGLITGAVYLESKKLLALSGYSNQLNPFLYLLYDFKDTGFFSGNKRKIEIDLPFHQIEGITSEDGIKFYMSNEHFSLFPVTNTPQKIHLFNLNPFLGSYLDIPILFPDEENNFIISPVPAHDMVKIKSLVSILPAEYKLIDISGRIVMTGTLSSENSLLSVSGLAAGLYILKIGQEKGYSYKVIIE